MYENGVQHQAVIIQQFLRSTHKKVQMANCNYYNKVGKELQVGDTLDA